MIKYLTPRSKRELKINRIKDFMDSILWKTFAKYELACLAIVLFVYFTSPNKFPHNFYMVPLAPLLLGITLFIVGWIHFTDKNKI